MIKPWSIGTDIISYIKKYVEFFKQGTNFIKVKHVGKEIAFLDIDNPNEFLWKTSKSTASQFLRVLLGCKFISISNWTPVSKDKTLLFDKIIYEIHPLKQGETIGDFIVANNINDLKLRMRGEGISFPSEPRFLFSLMSTILSINSEGKLDKFINQKIDAGSVSKYSRFYSNVAMDIINSKININQEFIPIIRKEVISFDKNTTKLIESIDGAPSDKASNYYQITNLKSQIDSIPFTFGSFIKNNFTKSSSIKIPIYQRIYRWPWQTIKTLLFDINSINEKDSSGFEKLTHYIGNIVVSVERVNGATVHKLIDGQQRLTTLTLIMRALYDISKYKKIPVDILCNERFSEFSEDSISKTFSRVEGNNDFDVFKDVINGKMPNKRSIIYENYKSILNWMNINLTKDQIIKFWNKLMNGVTLVSIEDLSSNEYKLFEKLNTGSEPLNTIELFKNFILNKLVDETKMGEKEMQKLFEEKVIRKLSSKKTGNPTLKEVNDYIYTVIRSEDEPLSDDTIFNQYKNFINTKYFDNAVEDSLENILDEISNSIQLYKNISDYNEIKKNTNPLNKIADFLVMLNGRSVYYPLIMKIIKLHIQTLEKPSILEINKVRKLLKVIEIFEVRMQITSYRGQSLSKKMEKIVSEVNKNTSDKELFILFSGSAKSTDIPNIKEFASALKNQSIANKPATMVMFRIENYCAMKGWEIKKDNEFVCIFEKKAQREHLMPQKWQSFWTNDLKEWTNFESNELAEEVNETINMIGNAFPIPDWSNKEISNQNLFSKMKNYKEKNNYAKLVSIDGNDYISKIENQFTPSTIRERSKEIAKLASEIWKDIN